jgi:hypothetical protein
MLRHSVNTICEEIGWDSLSVSSWRMLKSIINLLEPFAAFTQLVSADKFFSAFHPLFHALSNVSLFGR